MRATELFDKIEKFAEYSFNHSHSVSYATIAYQTAYLKANYYHEYMCALLDNYIDDDEKKEKYIGECFEHGVKVLPPKINSSTLRFELTEENDIIFPFTAIKGLGTKICEKIIKEQFKKKFTSLIDFCYRVKPDKKTLTALLESNCFSMVEDKPKRWLYLIDYLCEAISDYKKDSSVDLLEAIKQKIKKDLIKSDSTIQTLVKQKRAIKGASKKAVAEKDEIQKQIDDLTNKMDEAVDDEYLKHNYDFTQKEIAENEETYFGYQITTNVKTIFQKYKNIFDFQEIESLQLSDTEDRTFVNTVGEIKELRVITTKKTKKPMAFATLVYNGFSIGLTIFPSQWGDLKCLKNGDFVVLKGELEANKDVNYGEYQIIVNKMNILTCLLGEESYVQDMSGWTNEQKMIYNQGIKVLSEYNYNNNVPITKILLINCDGYDKPKVTKGMYWIGELDRYRAFLRQFKLN